VALTFLRRWLSSNERESETKVLLIRISQSLVGDSRTVGLSLVLSKSFGCDGQCHNSNSCSLETVGAKEQLELAIKRCSFDAFLFSLDPIS